MTTAQTYALMVPVGLVCYAILRNRLTAFVQPLRLSAAQKGEELLADPRMTSGSKKYLNWWLDRAYSPSMIWKLCLLMPVAAIAFVWTHKEKGPVSALPDRTVRDSITSVVNRIAGAHIFSSPILGLVFLAEVAIALFFFAIFGGSIHFFLRMLVAVESGVSMRGSHA